MLVTAPAEYRVSMEPSEKLVGTMISAHQVDPVAEADQARLEEARPILTWTETAFRFWVLPEVVRRTQFVKRRGWPPTRLALEM
jgi:hypothetical protein